MADRIIRGSVNANGTIKEGQGFKVVREETGVYVILYDRPFASNSTPTVVTCQNYRNWSDINYDGGWATDNSVLVASLSDRCKIITGNEQNPPNFGHLDRNFTFIAIGLD